MLLLPIDITITKKGTTPPTDGVLVKKGDMLNIKLCDIPQNQFPLTKDQIVWQWRQIKRDGSFSDWTPMGDQCKGVEVDYTTTASGIYQIKAVLTVGDSTQDCLYVRKQDAAYSTDSHDNYNPIYKKGQPDYVGIVDADWQISVRHEAQRNLGSTAYAQSATLVLYQGGPTLQPGDNKCNAFVYHKASDGGAPVPLTNGHYLTGLYPPAAYDWWDASYSIPGWARLQDSDFPQPGYVTCGPDSQANGTTQRWGHVGILDYDGAWIQAGTNTVNRYPHLTTPTNPYQPAGFRKYTGN